MFDNSLLEKLLTSNLTKRQLKILLLILRFSSGYQKTYAILRRADFAYAGVSQGSITAELRKLSGLNVIGWDTTRDLVWINRRLGDWAVENPVESKGRFFRMAARNSPKRQLALYWNRGRKLPDTGSPSRERKRYKLKETAFLEVLKAYHRNVSPLSVEEAELLREAVEKHGPASVIRATAFATEGNVRSFAHFLRLLEELSERDEQRAALSTKEGLQRLSRLFSKL